MKLLAQPATPASPWPCTIHAHSAARNTLEGYNQNGVCYFAKAAN